MAKTISQILSKLDRPPAAHNWALCNYRDKAATTKAMVGLALGFPSISYQWALKIIALKFADGRTDQESTNMLQSICPPMQLEANLELLTTFLQYAADNDMKGIPVLPEYKGHYQAGPNVRVPVSPTTILRSEGKLKPLVIVPWATSKLDTFQRRLLSTLYEDAIYTLTDFANSDGEVLFFPRDKHGVRRAESWSRDHLVPLTKNEIVEQVETFVAARDDAKPIIIETFQRREFERARRQDEATARQEELQRRAADFKGR
jgi:hypothetical protein